MRKNYTAVQIVLTILFLLAFCEDFLLAQTPNQSSDSKIYIMGTNIPPEEIEKIARAIPEKAFVKPKKSRTLLIFDLNVNYGGHRSAAYANVAFQMMGEKTGAFKTVISSDPQIFQKEKLKNFDAVFFNNNVGNLFTNRDLRENLAQFIYSGRGLMGVHGTSVAFTKWPGAVEDWEEFGIMLGARGANHRENTELITVNLDDPVHPLNRVFGEKPFEYRDEFFRFHEVYSRDKLRVLLSIDTNKLDLSPKVSYGNTIRKDHDYALAWVRNYGRGRVFYSTIAHNPYVFYDPLMLKFYLSAVQFVLGDLDAPTTQSGKINEFTHRLENLKWRAGALLNAKGNLCIEEFAKLAAENNFLEICVPYGTKIFSDKQAKFSYDLPDSLKAQFRLMLDKYGVRLTACEFSEPVTTAWELPKIFEFLRIMGIESVVVAFNQTNIERFLIHGKENEIKIAVKDSGKSDSANQLAKFMQEYPQTASMMLVVSKNNIKKSADYIDSNKGQVRTLLFDEELSRNLDGTEKIFDKLLHSGDGLQIWFSCDKESVKGLSERALEAIKNSVSAIR